jgi:hypothetical protein
MNNKFKSPGFGAVLSISQSVENYLAHSFSNPVDESPVIQPQYRSQVRRHCGPCINGKRQCISFGYECTITGTDSGSPDHIPPNPGHLHCVPEVFREWEVAC